MTKRYQKNISHYQWRPSFIKGREAEFESWLIDQGADIHTMLSRGEVFKFSIGEQVGLLFETMMCNRFYFEFAKRFKKVA